MPATRRSMYLTMNSVRIKPRPTTAPETGPEKRSIWLIVLGWLKEESFYREVTTRVLSIVVAGLLAYLYALAAGYVATPSGRAILFMAMSATAAILMYFSVRARVRNQPVKSVALLLLGIVIVIAAIVVNQFGRSGDSAIWDKIVFVWAAGLAVWMTDFIVRAVRQLERKRAQQS